MPLGRWVWHIHTVFTVMSHPSSVFAAVHGLQSGIQKRQPLSLVRHRASLSPGMPLATDYPTPARPLGASSKSTQSLAANGQTPSGKDAVIFQEDKKDPCIAAGVGIIVEADTDDLFEDEFAKKSTPTMPTADMRMLKEPPPIEQTYTDSIAKADNPGVHAPGEHVRKPPLQADTANYV